MLDVEQGWDSNIYNASEDAQGSLVTRISPSLWLENQGELGNARLGLIGIGRSVWEDSQLSGIDGLARGNFDRKLTPRLTLFGDGYLEHYSGYDEIDSDGLNQGNQPIRGEQPSWKRDRIGGGFSYLLTERLSTSLSGSTGRVNYESIDSATVSDGYYRDRSLYDGRWALTYQLTAHDQLGLSVDFDDTSYQNLGTGTNDSAIWTYEAGWTRSWTQFWSTTARVGFSSLDAEQNDVPQTGTSAFNTPVSLGQSDFSSSSTGLVGSLSLRRVFPRSALELGYERSTQSTGGSGRTNFDVDSFTLSWTQRLAERVKLTLTGNYQIYQNAVDETPSYAASLFTGTPSCAIGGEPRVVATGTIFGIPNIPIYQCFGASSDETRHYTTLVGRLEWQLRRTLSTYAVARYYATTTDQKIGGRSEIETEDLDKFTFGVGFRYYHDLGL